MVGRSGGQTADSGRTADGGRVSLVAVTAMSQVHC